MQPLVSFLLWIEIFVPWMAYVSVAWFVGVGVEVVLDFTGKEKKGSSRNSAYKVV